MKKQPLVTLSKNERRKMLIFNMLLYALMGASYYFAFINYVYDVHYSVVLHNLVFAILFTVCFFLRKKNLELVIILVGIFYQAYIFGHAYYFLPGKQIEAGLGVMTCALPIFKTDKKPSLWFFFITNFVLFHIVLFNVGYENIFYFKYGFYIVIFIMIRALVNENRKYETELIQKQEKIEQDAKLLKEADELKNRFFTNISHELRTPLTLILSPIRSILNSKELSNRNSTYLQLMEQNALKLLKRINELLELSRLGNQKSKVNLSPVNIHRFVKRITAIYEGEARIKGIQLDFFNGLDTETTLSLDASKLEMIISNYLSNALKFTAKGGNLTVKIQKEQSFLQVSVSDTGIGIPADNLEKVFLRFQQVKREDYYEGTGIGLALCKELAELQNGKVWAESELSVGSTFYLQLPFVETFAAIEEEIIETVEAENMLPLVTTSNFSKEKLTVLIVEDNRDLRNYIASILQDTYNIETAKNGKEAWEWLVKPSSEASVNRQPSAVISDIMMPVMNGTELLKSIKANDKFRHIPMIMVTAHQSLEVKIDALRIGVDDYLTKPFREEELKVRIANLIKNSQSRNIPIEGIEVEEEEKEETPNISIKDLEWLKQLEVILLENLTTKDFKLADIAPQLEVSYRHLRYKIKKITGLTLKQYQTSIRLSKARDLLKSDQVKTVHEAMYQIGLENYYHFSKMYEAEYGIKPSAELK